MATNVIKQGKLLFYDGKQADWAEADVKLLKNSVIEYTIKGKLNKIVMKPHVAASPSTKANYKGLFVINTVEESYYNHGPMFSATEPQEGERWMQLINYTRLKNNVELMHKHPLTLCTKAQDDNNTDNVCPSVLRNVSVSCVGCNTTADPSEAYRCEFCKFELCGPCKRAIEKIDTLLYTSEHHPHSLVKFPKAKNPLYFSSDYNGNYTCDRCKKQRNKAVYHCVECGDYDECEYCGIEVTKKTQPNTDVDMTMALGHLPANIVKKDGTKFSLSLINARNAPQAMSLITNKHWDLSTIDDAPAPAYFEVTFNKLNHKEGKVCVGLGNQIFVQNQLVGYQQNSFGYMNTGVASQNVGANPQQYPAYTVGDTVGVGILIDSFNQRRLYFTKNGQLLEFYSQRVHIGMDCFPAVSFTRGSGVEFEVKLNGPFKFDLNSLPNYRSDKVNRFETMPTEIMGICFAHVVTGTAQAALFRRISKKCSEVAGGNIVWKSLYLSRWPKQNAKLNVKSWIKFYKRRLDAEVGDRKVPVVASKRFIENCDFEFECPLIWETLKATGKEGERHCDKCKKTVYEVNDASTMQNYIELGRCVTFIPKGPTPILRPPEPRLMGLPPALPKPVPKPYQNAIVRGSEKPKSNNAGPPPPPGLLLNIEDPEFY